MTTALRRRVATVLAASTLATTVALAHPAAAVPVGVGSVGYNWSGNSAPASVDAGSRVVRLWDSGTLWRHVEPSKPVRRPDGTLTHAYRWDRLDRLVASVVAKGSTPLIVLGGTPAWAAGPGTSPSLIGPAANRVPDLTAWATFVRAVADRYKAKYPTRTQYFQVWNEANLRGFFDGTPEQMAAVLRQAWLQTHYASPGRPPVVVGPSMAGRSGNAGPWLNALLAAGGSRYAHVQSASMYPAKGGTPETALAIARGLRAVMAARGVGTQQLWDTEVNYFLATDRVSAPGGPEGAIAAGYVARTFLLAPVNRVSRTFWYSWDARGWGGIYLVKSDRRTLTAPGRAMHEVSRWMNGADETQCGLSRGVVWYCKLSYSGGRSAMAVWTQSGSTTWRLPADMRTLLRLDGSRAGVRGGAVIGLNQVPVLVRNF